MNAKRPNAKKQLLQLRGSRLFPLMVSLCLGLGGPALLIGCASKPVKATQQADGVQQVRVVVSNGYQPSHIEAKAGQPLKIEFYRDEEPGQHSCGEVLEIPAERVKLPLPSRESQIVEIKPQNPGQMEFRCGMNMLKGKITFR
ncbi:cupredoxin domain-containing protein [Vampirovibrio chlorellavorus]|uniref:cupredoxin domain-containing protein n=1 Tax=Vampirovibrio chlorellavorus TaxID=758823 RepID=UPI0026EDA069|nr:cupredoxin domain-containing protein [Vampirovibrio chlorellavorus]